MSLRDPLDANTNKELPSVPPAPPFRPDIPIGSPDVRQAYEEITKIAPELRGRASRIQVGPSGGAAEDLMESGFGPHQYGITNLMGTFSPTTHEISLNPNVANNDAAHSLRHTLAHELGHAAGYHEGDQMKQIEAAADQVFPHTQPKGLEDLLAEAFQKYGKAKVTIDRSGR
jgi:hypothetical protein